MMINRCRIRFLCLFQLQQLRYCLALLYCLSFTVHTITTALVNIIYLCSSDWWQSHFFLYQLQKLFDNHQVSLGVFWIQLQTGYYVLWERFCSLVSQWLSKCKICTILFVGCLIFLNHCLVMRYQTLIMLINAKTWQTILSM